MSQATTPASPIVIFSGYSWSSYVRSGLCIIGVVLNTINIIVFMSSKLKDPSYKYMLSKSAANWAYLALTFANEIICYCVNCAWSSSFLSSFFTIAVSIFFLSCLAVFRILIDLAISLHTFLILKNKGSSRKYTYLLIILVLFVASIVYNLQKPFTLTIIPIPGRNLFTFVFTPFGLSEFNRILNISQTMIRIFLAVVVLSAINTANLVLYTRRFKNRVNGAAGLTANLNVTGSVYNNISIGTNTRQSLTRSTNHSIPNNPNVNENKRSKSQHKTSPVKNITQMVIVSLFIGMICQIPFSVCFILSWLGVSSPLFNDVYTSSVFFVLISPCLDLFVYYFFNKLFKSVIDGALKKFFRF